jgi:DNA-binding response OmpR family regulator
MEGNMAINPSPLSTVELRPELLFVDPDSMAAEYGASLRREFRVDAVNTVPDALNYLSRRSPALIVTDISVRGGSGVDVCRAAKSVAVPPAVLVTTNEVERVPDALAAGCDAVLLKPFAPNLLYARIGRLIRERSAQLRERSRTQHAKADHLSERAELLSQGTNRVWPRTFCPYCNHSGVTSFEYASHRRAWYACLECRKVWIAKRQE